MTDLDCSDNLLLKKSCKRYGIEVERRRKWIGDKLPPVENAGCRWMDKKEINKAERFNLLLYM